MGKRGDSADPARAQSVRGHSGPGEAMDGLREYGAEPKIYPITKGELLTHCNHEELCDEVCLLE